MEKRKKSKTFFSHFYSFPLHTLCTKKISSKFWYDSNSQLMTSLSSAVQEEPLKFNLYPSPYLLHNRKYVEVEVVFWLETRI